MTGSDESALRVIPGSQSAATPHAPRQRKALSRHLILDGIFSGDRAILAQAITLIESSRAADRELAEQVIEDCLPSSGHSLRVGITGVPGAGKSSLIGQDPYDVARFQRDGLYSSFPLARFIRRGRAAYAGSNAAL